MHSLQARDRQTTKDFAFCFARYSYGAEVEYINVNYSPSNIEFDCVDIGILTYELMSFRSTPYWGEIEPIILRIAKNCKKVLVFIQDDYAANSITESFVLKLNKFTQVVVYTPIKFDYPLIYPRLYQDIEIKYCHTGYVEESHLDKILHYSKPFDQRDYDYANRVSKLPIWLGEQAQLKYHVSKRVAQEFRNNGAIVDDSSEAVDVKAGIEWFRFLGNARYTSGSLGGSSITDPKMCLSRRGNRIEQKTGEMSYAKLLKIKRESSKIGNFATIGPRLFEAAMMGTCQILVESEYIDGFEPGRDYLPIKSNFNNLEETISELMRDQDLGAEIARNAFETLISSGKHTYEKFVREIGASDPISKSAPKVEVISLERQLHLKQDEIFNLDMHDNQSKRRIKARTTMISNFTEPFLL